MLVEGISCRVIVPVRNGGERWREAAAALRGCVNEARDVLVVDSESSDGSDSIATEAGFLLHRIPVETFNHGGTRWRAVLAHAARVDVAVFLTQDAVPTGPEALHRLVASFGDADVAAAYGRQIPHRDAGPYGAHLCRFNFGPQSETRTLADVGRLGIKTAYCSNSFAAYRVSALTECGGFPEAYILGEDAFVAMRLLLAGKAVRYCADAVVRHSHDHGILEEMRRYFDFGVMHAQMPELIEKFGEPTGEGWRHVKSELAYVLQKSPSHLPAVPLRSLVKYLGYRLGRSYRHLPARLRFELSMTKGYWSSHPERL